MAVGLLASLHPLTRLVGATSVYVRYTFARFSSPARACASAVAQELDESSTAGAP